MEKSEEVLVSKINALLANDFEGGQPESVSAFSSDEFILVVLVLLSRVSRDDIYMQIWETQGRTRFVPFCRRWVATLQSKGSHHHGRDSVSVALRWIVIWTNRLVSAGTNCDYKNNADIKQTLQALCHLLRDQLFVLNEGSLLKLAHTHAQIFHSLLSVESFTSSPTIVDDSSLSALWSLFSKQSPGSGHDNPQVFSCHNEKALIMPDSPQYAMYDTLRQILNSSQADDGQSADFDTVWNEYEKALQMFLLHQGKLFIASRVCGHHFSLPSYWADILRYWWEKGSSATNLKEKQRRKEWTNFLLQLLIEECQTQHSTIHEELSSRWNTFWGSHWPFWSRLSTFGFASDDTLLRSLVWTATAHVIRASTWQGIFTLNDVKASSTWIATVVRFAVGEARIQLGFIVASGEGIQIPEECLILIQSTSRVVLQIMDLIHELVKENSDDEHEASMYSSIQLSAETIQHLRRALEECLDTVVQYLRLTQKRLPEVDTCVIRVLGSLLTEFDVFTFGDRHVGLPFQRVRENWLTHGASNDKEVSPMLLSVSKAIIHCPSKSRDELLIGLATVLASAEGDKRRVDMLGKSGVLENLLDFLESCWRDEHANDSTILLACDAIDLFLDVNPRVVTNELRCTILQWLKLAVHRSDVGLSRVLESALLCFARLQGESPPNEPDVTAVRLAYEMVTRGQGTA